MSGQASRCVIQSMQTWRLSLDFPQMQPFKSFFCNLLVHKNHTHSPSNPTLTKTAVREEKTMRSIVEEQLVKSPPAFPTRSQHMLGVNQLLGSPGKTYTHRNYSNNPIPSNPTGLQWFHCGTSFPPTSLIQNDFSK